MTHRAIIQKDTLRRRVCERGFLAAAETKDGALSKNHIISQKCQTGNRFIADDGCFGIELGSDVNGFPAWPRTL